MQHDGESPVRPPRSSTTVKTTPAGQLVLFAALAALSATSARAISISLHSSNVGIGSMSFVVSGTTITITENWTSSGIGVLEISGLEGVETNYTIVKVINNNSGTAWTRFANELLDQTNQGFDGTDPNPQPSFVPVGYSTSNDNDGLSFAQGSGLPRTSTVFGSTLVDELSDARDFIDFFNGSLNTGFADTAMTFGLRDNSLVNNPFLLVQRPNAFSRPPTTGVPDAASTWFLTAFSVAGLLALKRRRPHARLQRGA